MITIKQVAEALRAQEESAGIRVQHAPDHAGYAVSIGHFDLLLSYAQAARANKNPSGDVVTFEEADGWTKKVPRESDGWVEATYVKGRLYVVHRAHSPVGEPRFLFGVSSIPEGGAFPVAGYAHSLKDAKIAVSALLAAEEAKAP